MKICFISDTHGKHKLLSTMPEADIIAFTGDFSMSGSQYELELFLDWFSGLLQYKEKIFIAGNHDFICEKPDIVRKLVPDNVTYLFDESITIDGIKFYGTPWQPSFCNWAFNLSEDELTKKYNLIPDDVDILLTHTPPFGILDLACGKQLAGSSSLLNRVNEIRPKISAFGHIHESYGMTSAYGMTFVNASVLNEKYKPVNSPIIIEI